MNKTHATINVHIIIILKQTSISSSSVGFITIVNCSFQDLLFHSILNASLAVIDIRQLKTKTVMVLSKNKRVHPKKPRLAPSDGRNDSEKRAEQLQEEIYNTLDKRLTNEFGSSSNDRMGLFSTPEDDDQDDSAFIHEKLDDSVILDLSDAPDNSETFPCRTHDLINSFGEANRILGDHDTPTLKNSQTTFGTTQSNTRSLWNWSQNKRRKKNRPKLTIKPIRIERKSNPHHFPPSVEISGCDCEDSEIDNSLELSSISEEDYSVCDDLPPTFKDLRRGRSISQSNFETTASKQRALGSCGDRGDFEFCKKSSEGSFFNENCHKKKNKCRSKRPKKDKKGDSKDVCFCSYNFRDNAPPIGGGGVGSVVSIVSIFIALALYAFAFAYVGDKD